MGVPAECRDVIVVKRIAFLLVVQKIQPDVVTSVELVPFHNETVKTYISTTINCLLSSTSSPRQKLPKPETVQVKDIRAFLYSLEETADLRSCFLVQSLFHILCGSGHA